MAYTKQTWTDRQGTKLNKFTKANETLTTVELTNAPDSITQAGTPFSKTRMDYMEEGIRTGHVIGTPISDLSRVFRLTGNGIPTFPDNVAGTAYKNARNWINGIESWEGDANTTLTIESGQLKAVSSGTDISIQLTGSFSAKQVRFLVKTSLIQTVSVRAIVNGVYTLIKNTVIDIGVLTPIDLILPALSTTIFIVEDGTSAGDYLSIKDIYIGSGLFDTPVYDKACCNRATNYGVLPVKGTRGQALSFNGGSYLQFDNPVIGTTGTIAFKLKDVTDGVICWNDSYNSNGIDIYYSSGKISVRFSYSGGNVLLEATVSGTGSFVLTLVNGDIKLYRDTMIIATSTFANITAGANNLKIGREFSGYYLTGVIGDFRYDSRIWTQDDVTRYHNGDDAVDSQQKSATGAPNAIATYAPDGFLGEHGTFTPALSFGNASTGITYEYRSGVYNRLGKMCFCSIRMNLSSKGSSTGDCRISGLPFSAADNYSITIGREYAITYSGQLAGITETSAKIIDIITFSESGLPIPITDSNFSDVSQITLSITYFIS